MKVLKTRLGVMIWLFKVLSYSQITIDSGDVITIGDYVKTHIDTTVVGYTPGPAGSNQNWDFSLNLSPDLTDSVYCTTVPPTYQGIFTQANLMIVNKALDSMFLKKTNQEFLFLGISLNTQLGRLLLIFSDPEKIAIFPATYNTSYYDTAFLDQKFPYSQQPGVDSIRIKLIRYIYRTVDAYGSLKTPVAFFSNVLRSRQKVVEIDSIWAHIQFPSSWQILSTTRDTSYIFEWFGKLRDLPILRMGLKADSFTVKYMEWIVDPITSTYNTLHDNLYLKNYKSIVIDASGKVFPDNQFKTNYPLLIIDPANHEKRFTIIK